MVHWDAMDSMCKLELGCIIEILMDTQKVYCLKNLFWNEPMMIRQ